MDIEDVQVADQGAMVTVPGEVTFSTRVLRGKLPTPFLETADLVATLHSAPTIDEAADGAIHRMAQYGRFEVGGEPLSGHERG